MSMLAEKREKKRYNLQPRGKALYEDSNRFGTRMLEKMGWSKGKGLGPNETGNKEFVRVKYKSDNIGLGFEERDDQWTQHDNDFNGLLRSLNGSEQNSSAEEDLTPKTTGFGFQVEVEKEKGEIPQISGESLEEKSKKSKARVHYQKFTRGKDISRYSEKDLANIFGKKSLRVEKAVERQEEEEEIEKEEKQHNFGVTVVNTGTSIHDYFKEKMSMRKKIEGPTGDRDCNEDVTEEGLVNFDVGKSQKKKRRDRKDNVSQEPPEDREYNEDVTEEVNFDVDKSQKRKKGDCKDNVSQELDTSHKNKKSKKSSELISSEDSFGNPPLHSNHEDVNYIVLDNVEQETESPNRSGKNKKNKKSKHRVDTATLCETTEAEVQEESVVETVSKKRKRKDKIEELLEEDLRENEQVETLIEAEEVLKKKKKKKKDKREYHEDDKEDLIQETLSDNTLNSRKELAQTDEHESKSSKYKKRKLSVSGDLEEEGGLEESHPNEASVPLEISKEKSKLKKSKNQKDEVQVEASPSNTTNSVDEIKDSENYCVFQLNGFNAEIFRYINFASFSGSNFSDIVGYGLTKNIKLEINSKRMDTQKIQNMWSRVLNKYTYKKRRNLDVKSVKKKNVFRIL